MKKNYSGKWLLPLVLLLLLFACKQKTSSSSSTATHEHAGEEKYTCPMHPQIIKDAPGTCPICGMDLVPMQNAHTLEIDSSILPLLKPVNEQVVSSMPTIKVETRSQILSVPVQGVVTYDTRQQASIASRVAGRIEKMNIKYNFQPIKKGQLIMEIYSPDLAAAQRELIYISRSDNDAALLQKARQRLSLLGMQPAQINQLIKTGKPIYRVPVYSSVSGYIVEKNSAATSNRPAAAAPASAAASGMDGMGGGDNTAGAGTATQNPLASSPVLTRVGQYVGAGETIFTIYTDNNMVAEFSFTPALAAEIKRGQKLMFQPVSNPAAISTGIIGLIEPVQANGENFTVARVFLSGTNLKPGQLLSARIPVVKNRAYWLPQEALLQLGTKSIVFKKENGVFIPKEVKTGITVNGMVEIPDLIGDWELAKNASFLVDSESFIRLQSNDQQ